MKNLFANLAPLEICAAGVPRKELSAHTNSILDAIRNSALKSGYDKGGKKPSSINTLTHIEYVQDESPDFSKVAEECVLVFMPEGSDDLIENISDWDNYDTEMTKWTKRVPGCNNIAHPTLRTLRGESGFFVFEHETPFEFQYSVDGGFPHDIYAAYIFTEWIFAASYAPAIHT